MTTTRQPLDAAPLYSIWSVQDTLLQYYRAMFITAESFLVAVAASVAASAGPLAWTLIVAGLALLAVWSKATRARARDVQFTQQLIRWHEAGKSLRAPFTTFKTYQEEWPKNHSFAVAFDSGEVEPFIAEGVWPPRARPIFKFWIWGTRVQMEIVLPVIYLLSWFVISLYVASRP